ncbi:MAG: YCF48-related protein [Ignavibacteria bacterium]
MKKYLVILFAIIALGSSLLYPQTGWQWVNPYPSIHNISNIKFFNNSTGYSKIGRFLYRTTNEGNQWKMTDTASGYAYSFLNANTGFSAINGIIKTTNGGVNWSPYGVSNWISGHAMTFLNESTGIVAAANFTPIGEIGVICSTTNSGVNWSYNEFIGLRVYDFKFINSNMVIAATIDSGTVSILKSYYPFNNWQKTKSDISAYNYISISIPDSTTMFIMVDNYMKNDKSPIRYYKSTNGGSNWFNTGADEIYDTEFLDENTGIAVGANGKIFRTTNQGNNWIGVYCPVNYDLLSVSFINSLTGYATGRYGAVLKTTNGGFNWSTNAKKFTSIGLKDIALIGKDTIITPGLGGNIFRTTNQGINWESYNVGEDIFFRKIFFIDKENGYVTGDYGKLFKTTNNGINWSNINTGFNDRFVFDVFFISKSTGFICTGSQWSNDGHLYKTTNEGVNWFTLNRPRDGNFFYIRFFDGIGYTGSWNNSIYRTTDFGDSWIAAYEPQINAYASKDIDFINSLTGFNVANDGYIYKTTNSGLNWFQHFRINNNTGLTNLNFINQLTGYVISGVPTMGGSPSIYCTTNGGNNWVNQLIPYGTSPAMMNAIQFSDSTTGYIVGDSGVVLKTTTGGFVGIKNVYVEIPKKYYLLQNYPNPFNPTTNIKFSIIKTGQVKLIVYDIIGREVQTLVNESLKPGTYEAAFDGSSLNSGVYFYKLVTGNFTETKKMILIK